MMKKLLTIIALFALTNCFGQFSDNATYATNEPESFYVPKSKVYQAAGYLFFFEDEIIISEISKEMSDTCILLSKTGFCVNCETILPIKEQYDVIEAMSRVLLVSQIENRDKRYIWMARASAYDGDFLKFYDLTH